MGTISSPPPILALLAATSRYDDALDWAAMRWQGLLQSTLLISDRFPFNQTDYYTATMGSDLRKQFLVSRQLADPGQLGHWKTATNRWEEEYALATNWPEARPLNLDPGYLAQDKLVLASTKNHAHRLYLNAGIYAEITLQFRAKQWQACPWTYPDYLEPSHQYFFTAARNHLREQLGQRPR